MDNKFDKHKEERERLLKEADEATQRGDSNESAAKLMEAFTLLPGFPDNRNQEKKGKNTSLLDDIDLDQIHSGKNKNTPPADDAGTDKAHTPLFNGNMFKAFFIVLGCIAAVCAFFYLVSVFL